MMEFKVLYKKEDLIEYRENFYGSLCRDIGKKETTEIPLDYLRNTCVVGLYHGKQMIAGYIINYDQHLRLLDFVPGEKRNSLKLPSGASWSDCCEVVCVWKSPQVSKYFMSAVFWPRILLEVFQSDKKYLLGHNQSEKLDKFYTALSPNTLYAGLSTYGLPSRLFIYDKKKILMGGVANILFETPRRFFKEQLKEVQNRIQFLKHS